MTGRWRVPIEIVVLALSVIVTVLCIEGLLRLFWPQVFDPHPAGLYIDDPDVGYVLTPGFEGRFTMPEFRTHIRVGSTGLRGVEPGPRTSNSRRILCIGDSFTFGWGVEDDQAFPAVLERMLRHQYGAYDVEVLNGGVPGYGTDEELVFLETRGPALDPDLVILQFFPGNDFLDNRHPARERYEIRDGMLARRPGTRRTGMQREWLHYLLRAKRYSHLLHLVSERVGHLGARMGMLDPGASFTAGDVERTRELLVEIAARSKELEARTLLFYGPTKTQVISENADPPPGLDVVAQAGLAAGTPHLDLSREFRDHPERLGLFFAQDSHWTAQAHEMVAAVLARRIAELDLLGVNEHPDRPE